MIPRNDSCYHHPIAVHIDMLGNADLRHHLPAFRAAGGARTVAEVRELCRQARERGHDVVVPCAKPNANGQCSCPDEALSFAEVP